MIRNKIWIERLCEEASRAIGEQAPDGSMPAGCNGPYGHKASPLRNTGHWLFLWSHLWRLNGDNRFRQASEKALAYLLRDDHRPHRANWMQRYQKGRDACNGVIGAAWTGEALWAAVTILESEAAFNLARDVFSRHCFDPEVGLWHRFEVDGRVLSIDQTLNHQLWFAATASRLHAVGADELKDPLDGFFEQLSRHFVLENNGVIRHRMALSTLDQIFHSGGIPFKLFQIYKSLRTGLAPVDPEKRDLGYHAFNLHACAVLYRYLPEACFWASEAWKNALAFARSESHIVGLLSGNSYAYPYNPVGFEMAFALQAFIPDSQSEQNGWAERQWAVLSKGGRTAYGDGSIDPPTAKARLYEAAEWLLFGEKIF